MQRREFIALLGGAAAWPLQANAQTPAIGFLSSRSARDSVKVVAAFGKGLGEAGFTEGGNLSIEYASADGALDRLPEMAAELVQRPISVLVAAAEARGLGSFPCAGLTDDKVREGVAAIRSRTKRPINLNFFCHAGPSRTLRARRHGSSGLRHTMPSWRGTAQAARSKATIYRFTEATCGVVEELRPEVVASISACPAPELMRRVERAGCKVIGSATTRREAVWLAERGVDAVIAQGAEAGGHRGMFSRTEVATQIGTFALVQQIVEAVDVPVIAAGGIRDGNSIAAAVALGAAGVQIGTAYLCCPEATTSALHRQALAEAWPRDSDYRRLERTPGTRAA